MSILKTYWSWSGIFIGYRLEDGLFSRHGKQLGFFAEGEEVYSCTGNYMGEVRGDDRLITNVRKKTWLRSSVVPAMQARTPGRLDVGAKNMIADHQDFPSPPAN